MATRAASWRGKRGKFWKVVGVVALQKRAS